MNIKAINKYAEVHGITPSTASRHLSNQDSKKRNRKRIKDILRELNSERGCDINAIRDGLIYLLKKELKSCKHQPV